MINFDEQTINEVHIKPDRFGMAAISTIYKAFGDNVRSKEMWPWSERVGNDWQWEASQGIKKDLEYAISLINYALFKFELDKETENNEYETLSSDTLVKDLSHRLKKLQKSINTAEDITKAINNTSEYTENDISIIKRT